MATGGVFKLVANDGKADRMLLATALLRQRILDIFNSRKHAGKADLTPTLVDIERTHILYVNAHFKPFAAIGFEYSKIMPQSGTPVFGGSVTFSIPQYGDFFYDMVVRTRIAKAYTNQEYYTGTPTYNINIDNYTSGGVVPLPAESYWGNFVRYCVYPGDRIFNKVSFEVNGNPLDSYDSDTAVMYNKFTIPTNKRSGYNTLTGQENIKQGITPNPSILYLNDPDYTNTPQDVLGGWNRDQTSHQIAPNEPAGPTPDAFAPINLSTSAYGSSAIFGTFPRAFCDGPQTPKVNQPPLELWTKLRFWFNDDVRLAIPSVSIPFGQRFINIEICQQNDLLYEWPYLWYPAGFNKFYYFKLLGINANIDLMEMYINNIFVNPEIHDIYIRRIGFSLVRVYKKQSNQVNTSTGNILLSSLKWPVEFLFVGFQPKFNRMQPQDGLYSSIASVNPNTVLGNGNWMSWRDWHYMSRQMYSTTGAVFEPRGLTLYAENIQTINEMGVTSHGIPIYASDMREQFYNNYLPYNYGGVFMNTTDDSGAYLINFALFPRSYQPSGHLNISRARETYISYSSTYITSKTPCNFICIAVAINFLLITDGSAILRYST